MMLKDVPNQGFLQFAPRAPEIFFGMLILMTVGPEEMRVKLYPLPTAIATHLGQAPSAAINRTAGRLMTNCFWYKD